MNDTCDIRNATGAVFLKTRSQEMPRNIYCALVFYVFFSTLSFKECQGYLEFLELSQDEIDAIRRYAILFLRDQVEQKQSLIEERIVFSTFYTSLRHKNSADAHFFWINIDSSPLDQTFMKSSHLTFFE